MKRTRSGAILFVAAALMLATSARAQQPPRPQGDSSHSQGGMAGTDVSDMERETGEYPEAARTANDEMSMGSMDMNPHMFMTELQPSNPGDQERAQEILDILRKSIGKYKDYRVALADGYRIFLPKV